MKRWLGYLLYLLVSTSLLILLVEGAARVLIHFKYGHPGKTYGLWIADPELGATHRPNGYNTHTSLNNYGFRNREDVLEPKPPGALRIIAFGGSTTFGYNLQDGETYTDQLQVRLRRVPGYEQAQVLNAGRITYSAGHNLILMKRLVPVLRPDYALLYEGVNELFNAWVLQQERQSLDALDSRFGVLGKGYDQNRWLKRNSVIVRFIDYVVKKYLVPWRKLDLEIHPWVVENYEHVLREMLGFLRAQGAIPIVLRYPSVEQPDISFFSDLSAEIACEEGVIVLDLESRFDRFGVRERDYFADTGVHVTSRGAEVIADVLAELINELERKRRLGQGENGRSATPSPPMPYSYLCD